LKRYIRTLTPDSKKYQLPELPGLIKLPALGEEWTVQYNSTSSSTVQARSNGNGILVVSGRTADKKAVGIALKRWLAREAKTALVPWLSELGETSGLTFKKVTVRGQRTRWGSCSTNGTISLNYRLLFLEPDLVRYVLHHELCHTVHPNHSHKFWTSLEELEPGCRALSRSVRSGMKVVPEWAKDSPKSNVQSPKFSI
jgi:predicted metal-dependent hydrolase